MSASKLLSNDNIRHDPAADGEQEVELIHGRDCSKADFSAKCRMPVTQELALPLQLQQVCPGFQSQA